MGREQGTAGGGDKVTMLAPDPEEWVGVYHTESRRGPKEHCSHGWLLNPWEVTEPLKSMAQVPKYAVVMLEKMVQD